MRDAINATIIVALSLLMFPGCDVFAQEPGNQLADLIAGAEPYSTITLDTTVRYDKRIVIDRPITIDGNGAVVQIKDLRGGLFTVETERMVKLVNMTIRCTGCAGFSIIYRATERTDIVRNNFRVLYE